MPRNRMVGWVAVVAVGGLSGCCSFWEKHCAPRACAQPVYCQPVCCQPVAGPPPASQAPQPAWNAPRGTYYPPGSCYCE